MRRLSIFMLVAVAGMVAVSTARADWQSLAPTTPGVTGLPLDAELRDAGDFTLAARQPTPKTQYGAYEILGLPDGGTSVPQAATTPAVSSTSDYVVSAYVDGAGCLSGITANAVIFCSADGGAPIPQLTNASRAQHTVSGGTYVAGMNSAIPTYLYTPAWNGSWSDLGSHHFTTAPSVGALRVGSNDYGLFGLSGGFAFLAVDGVGGSDFQTNVSNTQEVQLFNVGPAVQGLIAGDGGMELASFAPDGSVALTPADGLGGYLVTGVSFEYGTGGPEGDGFGMAVGQSGGTTTIFSAVPDPGAPARTWVPNTNIPYSPPSGLPGTVTRVRCRGGRFCVLLTNGSDAGVFVYYNSSAPWVGQPTIPTIDEGDAGIVSVDAGDNDGDAIFLTWDAGAGPALVLGAPPDGGLSAVTVSLDAGTSLCGLPSPVSFPLWVTASDGLASHLTSSALTVNVRRTILPGPPVVSPPPPAHAGGPGVFAPVTAGAGCPPQSYQWSELVDAGFTVTLAPNGAGATFTPPAFYCSPDAGVGLYQVRAFDGALLSDAGTVSVLLEPWGPPGPPLSGGTYVQDAGEIATYFATGAHPCFGRAGFPGVDTIWSFSTTVPGVRFEYGGQQVDSGVIAPSIDLVAPACTAGTVFLGAVAQTHGEDAGLFSPDAGITVQIQTVLAPIADAGLALSAGYDPATTEVGGTVAAAVDCGLLRGLMAVISLQQPDGGGTGETTSVALPGTGPQPWRLPAPGGCAGGTFEVNAQLVDDGGTGASAQLQVTTPLLPAGVGSIVSSGAPIATCQGGVVTATTTLTASPGPGQCPTASMSWSQVGGPPATLLSLGNDQVQVEATGAGFGDLVGRSLHFRATASAGNGTGGSADTTVQISSAKLVDIQHLTDLPVASESGILGVAVRLTNATGCGISNAEYRESLDGLRFVPGSARLDGQPVGTVLQQDQLILSELELPAGSTRQFTFSARPRLLTASHPGGQAFLNGVPISDPEQGLRPPQPVGCGCSGGGAGFSAAALALVGLMLRRGTRRRS